MRFSVIYKLLFLFSFSLFSSQSFALKIDHDAGSIEFDSTPQRVVVLAFSFVDALAIAGVSPVGIADDGDKNRVIKRVRDNIEDWQSVGSRYQPSLEAIAALKPDLIIADSGRHHSIYQDLTRIAPTLMLKSRGVTYQENLLIIEKIALAVDKQSRVEKRLIEHKKRMLDFKNKLSNKGSFQFAVTSEKGMWLHSPYSYAGSVIEELALTSPLPSSNKQVYLQSSFEQLLSLNPDWLFVGQYSDHSVLDKWQKSPLWKMLTISKSQQVVSVSANVWSLASGLLAAEQIAEQLTQAVKK
ncbi:Fe(3+) dicitrate ABC transporter substrate-binding protein [Psychromonas sp. Urea-02u-13]|uniref:Fe(3+) dicitrate ABC transporter substrate-binding protein n=1 Tax=Psychromonas sp. Urea-02u-13 TaxID=2058326 RepID=UPI000C33F044|nr:Fe(3+) dicitrate ABC transporter substrate-binding protein [Psychromonas sp. Urea-02u-13]PKG39079.1 Fe(3+)-dicitrate ABC transporter substrate-binding protein FecB [Psychromonas sp. Urea-02u-13]